ncbi:S-protein homolog 31 [Linum grandiflorum]
MVATVVVAAVATILLSAITPSSAGTSPDYHVHIVNDMSGNKVLLVRCRSSDQDLGDQNVVVGSEFEWTFERSVWQSTNWVCYLVPDYNRHAFFQAYTDFTPDYDHNVYWVAKEDGIYFRDGSGIDGDVLKFIWHPGLDCLINNNRVFSF